MIVMSPLGPVQTPGGVALLTRPVAFGRRSLALGLSGLPDSVG
jgi:hypothetical protein